MFFWSYPGTRRDTKDLRNIVELLKLIVAHATIDWPSEKIMSQIQYVRMLEKEIQKINKIIDQKIMRGQDYRKEARDHRLMLRRMRYHNRQTISQRVIDLFFRKDIRNIYA